VKPINLISDLILNRRWMQFQSRSRLIRIEIDVHCRPAYSNLNFIFDFDFSELRKATPWDLAAPVASSSQEVAKHSFEYSHLFHVKDMVLDMPLH
jgi:hypothetical protein